MGAALRPCGRDRAAPPRPGALGWRDGTGGSSGGSGSVSARIRLRMGLELYLDLLSQPCRSIYIFARSNNIPFEFKQVELMKGERGWGWPEPAAGLGPPSLGAAGPGSLDTAAVQVGPGVSVLPLGAMGGASATSTTLPRCVVLWYL